MPIIAPTTNALKLIELDIRLIRFDKSVGAMNGALGSDLEISEIVFDLVGIKKELRTEELVEQYYDVLEQSVELPLNADPAQIKKIAIEAMEFLVRTQLPKNN